MLRERLYFSGLGLPWVSGCKRNVQLILSDDLWHSCDEVSASVSSLGHLLARAEGNRQ